MKVVLPEATDTTESLKKDQKKSRRSPTEPAEGKSRAFDALASFEQAIYKVSYLPSVLEFAGSVKKPGPYDLDHGPKRLLLTRMRHVFKELVSEDEYYDIKPGDLLCTEASQPHTHLTYIQLTVMLSSIRLVNRPLSGVFDSAPWVSSSLLRQ